MKTKTKQDNSKTKTVTEVNGGRLSMKRSIIGSRTAESTRYKVSDLESERNLPQRLSGIIAGGHIAAGD